MIYQIHQQDAELRGEARGISIGEKRGEARGISIGEKRGEARGISIGEERKAVDTAKSMMRENLPDDMISRVTGLPVSQVNKLRASLGGN